MTAVLLIVREGRVLVLLRGATAPWFPNTWNLPGGMVDLGETVEDAARRECLEETGFRVNGIEHFREINMGSDGVLHAFRDADATVGPVLLCSESSDHAWVDAASLGYFDFVPHVESLIRDVLTV